MKDLLCRRNIEKQETYAKASSCAPFDLIGDLGETVEILERCPLCFFHPALLLFIHYLNIEVSQLRNSSQRTFSPQNRGAHPAAFNHTGTWTSGDTRNLWPQMKITTAASATLCPSSSPQAPATNRSIYHQRSDAVFLTKQHRVTCIFLNSPRWSFCIINHIRQSPAWPLNGGDIVVFRFSVVRVAHSLGCFLLVFGLSFEQCLSNPTGQAGITNDPCLEPHGVCFPVDGSSHRVFLYQVEQLVCIWFSTLDVKWWPNRVQNQWIIHYELVMWQSELEKGTVLFLNLMVANYSLYLLVKQHWTSFTCLDQKIKSWMHLGLSPVRRHIELYAEQGCDG